MYKEGISTVSKEYLFPGKSITFGPHLYEYIYIEICSPIQMTSSSKSLSLRAGDCIFAQEITLFNQGPDIALFRMIKLEIVSITSKLTPIISVLHPAPCSYITSILGPLMDKFNCNWDAKPLVAYLNRLHYWPLADPASSSLQHKTSSRKIDNRLIVINRYLRKNHEHPITLQQLADLIHCNPVYLSNTYTKVFKISPIKHLQLMRLNTAKNLLITTNLKISAIAQRLGYISTSQFSDLFKRHTGLTPTEFRKNSHNGTGENKA